MKSLLSPAHGRTCRVLNHKPLKEKVRIMKKSMFALSIVAGAVAMLVTGCSSTSVETNRFGSQVILEMKKVEFIPQIQVGNKYITGSSQVTVYCGFIKVGDTSKQATGISFTSERTFWGGANAYQRAATYDACIKGKADILLAPQYTLTTEGHFFKKTVRCTVKGFPGYIRSVKLAPPCCPQAFKKTGCPMAEKSGRPAAQKPAAPARKK